MTVNRPSATARRVAMRRAAHQLLDDPKVFDDPISTSYRRQRERFGIASQSESNLKPRRYRPICGPLWRHAADMPRTNSRLAFDAASSQYVILDDGLDTFAYRNPHPEGVLRVFEVDHPATQTWKRARLEGSRYHSTRTIFAFVAVDLGNTGTRRRVAEFCAGTTRSKAAFFSWLGVKLLLDDRGGNGNVAFHCVGAGGEWSRL